jgi:hypothetical protein
MEITLHYFRERSIPKYCMHGSCRVLPMSRVRFVSCNERLLLSLIGTAVRMLRRCKPKTRSQGCRQCGVVVIGIDSGYQAAAAADAVLKDIAQKFEAFGKEAQIYFEGRARLLSVTVAVIFAFAAHVDAIDLLRAYLHDPNARAKAIEQTQAVTAQYKAAQEAARALKEVLPATAAPSQGRQDAS